MLANLFPAWHKAWYLLPFHLSLSSLSGETCNTAHPMELLAFVQDIAEKCLCINSKQQEKLCNLHMHCLKKKCRQKMIRLVNPHKTQRT